MATPDIIAFIHLPSPPLSISLKFFFLKAMDSSESKFCNRTKKSAHSAPSNSTPAAFFSSHQSTSTPTPFATKDSTPTAFLPANPMPHIFDPVKRLQQLKDGLNPKAHSTISTKANIRTFVRLSRPMRRARCL